MIRKLINVGRKYLPKSALSAHLDQQSIDAYRATLLLKCHEWHMQPQNHSSEENLQPTESDVKGFYAEAQSLDEDEMYDYSQKQIDGQMISLFKKIKICMNDNYPDVADEDDDDEDHDDDDDDKIIVTNENSEIDRLRGLKNDTNSNEINNKSSAAQTNMLLDKVGFELICKPSNCPNDSGNGIFIHCSDSKLIPAGTVIALFPGLVHLAEYTRKTEYVDQLLPDPNFMLVLRSDSTVIDCRTVNQCAENPYALAHLVNHVPKDSLPNVFQFRYDFPNDPLGFSGFPISLRKFIPNSWAKKPTLIGTPDRSALIKSMVLIASRPLKNGDELLMDYRLKGEPNLFPAWYQAFEKDDPLKKQHIEGEGGYN